ncbi:hypothetical protein Slin15195_G061550 [Septoria linicola]|uniref:Uncharacterized protein n=1 Tax=Septoria linicola TaxID=215465 RepID=A0A9Q9AW00_9PEZI|nr:hypothetical protein Slin15195_G061550 [Septoria linicola]
MPKHQPKPADNHDISYSISPNEPTWSTNGPHAEGVERTTPGTASPERSHSPGIESRSAALHNKVRTSGELGPDVLASVARDYARLTRSRDETSRRRLEAQIALQQSTDLQTWSRESQHELLNIIRGERETWPSSDRAVTAYNKAQADSNAADAHAQTVHLLERKLSSLEARLRERESQFYQHITSLLEDSSTITDGKDVAEEDSESTQSPVLHPLLASYYDKVGDIGICHEDIANLDLNFHEKSSRRALLIDQGDFLSQTNSTHDRNYKTSRRQLLHRLSDCIEATDVARQLCVRAELDIAQNKPDGIGKMTELEAAPPSLLEGGLPEAHRPAADHQADDGARESRVLHWVQDISKPASENIISVKKLDVEQLQDFQYELDQATLVDVRPPRRFSSPAASRKVLLEIEPIVKYAI